MQEKISSVLYLYCKWYLGISEAQQIIIDYVHNEGQKLEIDWLYYVLRLARFLTFKTDRKDELFKVLALFIIKDIII